MRKLHRDILSLAAPSILANITIPLVGMVDIAVAGHLGNDSPGGAAALIGGITIGSMLFDLLYWNFAFLRAGTGGITAQAYGRLISTPGADWTPIKDILFRALRIAIWSGVVLAALQWLVVWIAFLLVDCSPEVQELATRYFKIRIWAAPATLSLFALKGWFIGLQDTVQPMIADLIVNGVNILLSIGLGFGLAGLPHMGFTGIVLGTVIAQLSGFLFAILAAWHRCRKLSVQYPTVSPDAASIAGHVSFFSMNRDLILRSTGMIAVYIGFTVISARFGDTMLAVSSILMKLLMLFSYFSDGFAYAGEALTGRFIGAQDSRGVKDAVKGTFLWGFTLAFLFMLFYGIGGVPLLKLMTSDEAVIQAGKEFIPWLLLMPLIGVPAFLWDGIFTGATDTTDLRNSTLLCAVGFFAFWFAGFYIAGVIGTEGPSGKSVPGNIAIHILMGAYFVHLAIRSIYLTLRSPQILRKH